MAYKCLRTFRTRWSYHQPPVLGSQGNSKLLEELTVSAGYCAALLEDLPVLEKSSIPKGEAAFHELREQHQGAYEAVRGYSQYIFQPVLERGPHGEEGVYKQFKRHVDELKQRLERYNQEHPDVHSGKPGQMLSKSPWVRSRASCTPP